MNQQTLGINLILFGFVNTKYNTMLTDTPSYITKSEKLFSGTLFTLFNIQNDEKHIT